MLLLGWPILDIWSTCRNEHLEIYLLAQGFSPQSSRNGLTFDFATAVAYDAAHLAYLYLQTPGERE